MMRRSIRLDIGRIVFEGVDPGDRGRFERAFALACEAQLRTGVPVGDLREHVRLDLQLTAGATPERLATELARAIVDALEVR